MVSLLSDAMRARNAVLVISVCGLLSTLPRFAHAETHVAGEPASLRVETQNATLQEVLAALHSSFGLKYQISTDLNRLVNGTYSGSLREVILRLLDGCNFFLRKFGDDLEVVVIGLSASSGTAPTREVEEPVRGPALRRDF
jgi:hypothetical protein